MKTHHAFLLLSSSLIWLGSCSVPTPGQEQEAALGSLSCAEYFAPHEPGLQSGGVKMIPIQTPAGDFKVWTKRIGNNPRIKVLLLHGGPGMTHEYYECLESFFPREGIEFIYYDQLGSCNSDHPEGKGDVLWDLQRFIDEVEQVRVALGLNKDNFYLLGNSWGGLLGMEYALQHQQHLKGLIISNMMASIEDYAKYADEVLSKQFDPAILKEIQDIEAKRDYQNPRYMEILLPHFYAKHFIRMPVEQWPDAVNRMLSKINQEVYITMQGPSEFRASGKLEKWSVRDRLKEITVPTLVIGATHDTMDPKHMEWISTQVQNGQFLLCPNGSHLSMWDDQEIWMNGVIKFIKEVDAKS